MNLLKGGLQKPSFKFGQIEADVIDFKCCHKILHIDIEKTL